MRELNKKLGFVSGIFAGIVSLILSLAIFFKFAVDKAHTKSAFGILIIAPLLLVLFFRKKKFVCLGFMLGYVLIPASLFLVMILLDLFGSHTKSF